MAPLEMTPLAPFEAIAQLPLGSLDDLPLAPVVVVAPHPDDETLGCGGAIAQLRSRGYPVQVLVVSDGANSHPRSQRYPAPRLRQVRQAETCQALALLRVKAEAVTFLGLPDGSVPPIDLAAGLAQASPLAQTALEQCRAYLHRVAPRTIFVPYQFDPHRDHRASWQLVQGAIAGLPQPPRLIEYPIWDWDPRQRQPLGDRYRAWRLDIAPHLALKQQAIYCYRSQTTDLIDDDPTGFRLTPELIANFLHPWEIYLEHIP
ncbi:PIG-L deacetylase family protein [Nodosilinea sp. E11]|uniref:PIG-L deacetylase family protein n=1 Tax=Nodosilinea sp. E11 TaxID=3037479 RepID=UPI00293513D8|nr:PIG-L deacetylase family protein [Nodosilinea sp. E11]WOD40235.1 PIG-L deacetylase family protein [Nodosilinea sp. E11]